MYHEGDNHNMIMRSSSPSRNSERIEDDDNELPFAIAPPSVFSSTSTRESVDSIIGQCCVQERGVSSVILQQSEDVESSNQQHASFNSSSSIRFQGVAENSIESAYSSPPNHVTPSINEVSTSSLPPLNQSLISSFSSSNHFQQSVVDDTLGFTQLMQRADDTHAVSLSVDTRPHHHHRLQRTNNNLPNIAEGQTQQMAEPNDVGAGTDHHYQDHNLGTTITPPLSMIRKTQAQIVSNDSFTVSTNIPAVTVREAIDIAANPDLLRTWCQPLSSTVLLFENDNTNNPIANDDNLILEGSDAVNTTSNRQYDGEWVHATSSSLTIPPSNTRYFINFINTSKEYLGFPSCGNITMFIERSRGQVCITIGPFPNRISTALFGGSGIVVVNTIRIIENESEGGVDLISTVQLTSESSSSPQHGYDNRYDNRDGGHMCFMDELWDIAKGIVGIPSSSSSNSCCSSCESLYDYYSLEGFMKQNFQSIQKLSILIEEGGEVSACCFNSEIDVTREEWERQNAITPLLS